MKKWRTWLDVPAKQRAHVTRLLNQCRVDCWNLAQVAKHPDSEREELETALAFELAVSESRKAAKKSPPCGQVDLLGKACKRDSGHRGFHNANGVR